MDDRLLDKKSDLERYNISVYWRPSAWQYYSAYFWAGQQSFIGSPERTTTVGLSASYKLTSKLLFDINFQKSDFDRDQWIGSLNYTLPNNHVISLRGRHLDSDLEDKTSVMLVYAIPFGIPASRKKNIGFLRGRVYDAEDPQRRGIPNVIVNVNGVTAVTDKKGYFHFPSLKPGSYHLWVEERNIGLNRVTTLKTPLKVRIEGGEESRVDLGVTRSATLMGKVVVFRPVDKRYIFIEGKEEGKREVVEDYGLSNLLLQLENGQETIRRYTDRKGRFSFEQLRPGRWFLKVYNGNLPKFHYPEQETSKLELKPGAKEEVLIRILPRLRPLLLIEEGEIAVEE